MLYGGRSVTTNAGDPCGDGTFSGANRVCVFSDVWEWTGSSWVRVDVVDLDGDGGPGRRSNHGMTYLALRKEGVMAGGDFASTHPNVTWFFRAGSDARPAHVLQFELTRAGLDPPPFSIWMYAGTRALSATVGAVGRSMARSSRSSKPANGPPSRPTPPPIPHRPHCFGTQRRMLCGHPIPQTCSISSRGVMGRRWHCRYGPGGLRAAIPAVRGYLRITWR